MVMRVGGIVSGMDIEGMVNKLMEAERIPLNKLYQEQTMLEWKRDAFRDINSKLLAFELDNALFNMKLSSTYNPKEALSSQETAVTARANSSATNGTYEIKVEQLATSAMNVGQINGEESLEDFVGTHYFETYNSEGVAEKHEFTIESGDTLNDVIKKVNNSSDNIRMFHDENSGQIVLETTRTGKYNTNGSEIVFGTSDTENTFFTQYLGLDVANEKGGENARFTYNNHLELESRDNTYTLNGVTFDFHNTTEGNARVTVNNNVDQSFEAIKNFVDKYNEAIEAMNKSQTEERFRDFPPLTDAQKDEMTEDQIKKWEEKAQSGILRGESTIRNGMYSLRQSLQSKVETDGEYALLSQIGITTTVNYMDGGKLEIDEDKLKAALRDNPDDVYKLFSNNVEGESRGLINRFEDAMKRTKGSIEQQAGKTTQTLDNYSIGKQMKQITERISDFERRMFTVEQRYWNQFTQMEKAISNLNQQSSYLFDQFGGM